MNKTLLQARVEGWNLVNSEYNRLTPILIANFTPFVGQKVLKVGGLMEKFKELVPETIAFNMYREYSEYSLAFSIRACINYDEHFACYVEQRVNVGSINHMVLVKIAEFHPLKMNYTVNEIISARAKAREASEAYELARSDCNPFGEHDNG